MLKKILFITVAIVMILGIFSCTTTTPTPAPTPAPSADQTPAPAPSAIKLLFSEPTPPMDLAVKEGSMLLADRVKTLTNGKCDIQVCPAESLVKVADSYDAVLAGTADIARFTIGNVPGAFPLSEALSAPFTWNSGEACAATFYELIQKHLKDTEFKKVKVLYTFSISPGPICSNKKQVKTMEDLKGQKLANVVELGMKGLEKLGAIPTPVPFPEMYTALERGLVDGIAEPAWYGIAMMKMYEVSKYRTDVKILCPQDVIIMNLDKWNSLPDDMKKAIDENTGLKMTRELAGKFDAANKSKVAEVIEPWDKEKGNPPIYYLPDDELEKWRQTVAPVIEEWIKGKEAKGLPAREFYNDMIEIAKKYN